MRRPSRSSRSKPQAGADGEKQESDDGEQGENDDEQNAETGGEQSGEREKMVASDGKSAGSSKMSMQKTQTQEQGGGSSDKGKPYPEWDYREGRYKRNWSWVQEKPLAEANLAEANRLTNQYALALKRLKKAIQAQKPTRLAPKVRQFDGDDIDLNAVVGYVAEQRAGMSPQPAIYRRREIKQRDVSVTLLADMSTSIMQHLPEGGGRLVDRVRAGVLLFAESMEEVGDAYSIAGFCSKYRDNVSYYTIKDFDEPLTTQVKAVIGGISGRLATRMGAAIRHATARFNGVESRRRLLLILSDGRPEDYDDGGDRRYLHEDTRMAVKEAMAAGVHPFCITVDTMANQYLPQIFGRGHYLVLDHINSLPNKLPEIYLPPSALERISGVGLFRPVPRLDDYSKVRTALQIPESIPGSQHFSIMNDGNQGCPARPTLQSTARSSCRSAALNGWAAGARCAGYSCSTERNASI